MPASNSIHEQSVVCMRSAKIILPTPTILAAVGTPLDIIEVGLGPIPAVLTFEKRMLYVTLGITIWKALGLKLRPNLVFSPD